MITRDLFIGKCDITQKATYFNRQTCLYARLLWQFAKQAR